MFGLDAKQLDDYIESKCSNYSSPDYSNDYIQEDENLTSTLLPPESSCPGGEEIPFEDYDAYDVIDYGEIQTNPDSSGVHLVLKVKT